MPAPPLLHILLAEDDADVRHYVSEALVQAGHVVVAVEDGAAAIERLSGATFDLVVSDIRLPGASGHAILTHARRVSKRTEVILMTSFAAIADAVAAVKQGAHDYLTKPFEVEDLVQKVAALVDARAVDPAPAQAKGSVGSLEATVKQAEREHLLKALAVAGGKRTRAAELLGISRKNLWEKLRAHGLSAAAPDDSKPRVR